MVPKQSSKLDMTGDSTSFYLHGKTLLDVADDLT